MSVYLPPSLDRYLLTDLEFSTWIDHLPFAYDLVSALRPGIVVELGTHAGSSYFTMCRAVAESGIDCACYAVDTWEGDAHAGRYGRSVWENVCAYNAEHYAAFSTLLRERFETAIHRFDDGTIDLLHIDGFHSYDAVRRDFESWFPKLRPGGVMLFHDVMARMLDFGAWRFWSELSSAYASFTFHHGYGLGALRKPGPSLSDAPLLGYLFDGDADTHARLRAFYVHAAKHQDLLGREILQEQVRENVRAARRARKRRG